MNSLIYELLAALVLVICAVAAGIAKVVTAMHPGESADAVTVQANRMQHRQSKAQRRDCKRCAPCSVALYA
ncbi:hypothetical protein ACWC2K_27460 [Streptomyces chattanoogensis]